MIIVTGTKRSGTSMWMQVLIAAGFPAFGEAFPRRWGQTIKDANPNGFYESMLRQGIYYRTNPHPQTGEYFFPEQVEHHVVKVFIPGLVRSDRAFIGKVIATVRPWREYEASLERLHTMEDAAHEHAAGPPPQRMPPALEWWSENFMLLRDIAIRRYPVYVQSYEGLLQEPDKVIRTIIRWLGHGDADAAIRAVRPENRTQVQPVSNRVEQRFADRFDELYALVRAGKGLDEAFVAKLNATNEQLLPLVQAHQRAIAVDRKKRRQAAHGQKSGSELEHHEPGVDSDP